MATTTTTRQHRVTLRSDDLVDALQRIGCRGASEEMLRAVGTALRALPPPIHPGDYESALSRVRGGYWVGRVFPSVATTGGGGGGGGAGVVFDAGVVSGPAAVAHGVARGLGGAGGGASALLPRLYRLLASPAIDLFAIGIRDIPADSTVRDALIKRASSGTRSYRARGYTHFLALLACASQEEAHAIEAALHRALSEHPRWDAQVHNTPGRRSKRTDAPTLVYLALCLLEPPPPPLLPPPPSPPKHSHSHHHTKRTESSSSSLRK